MSIHTKIKSDGIGVPVYGSSRWSERVSEGTRTTERSVCLVLTSPSQFRCFGSLLLTMLTHNYNVIRWTRAVLQHRRISHKNFNAIATSVASERQIQLESDRTPEWRFSDGNVSKIGCQKSGKISFPLALGGTQQQSSIIAMSFSILRFSCI